MKFFKIFLFLSLGGLFLLAPALVKADYDQYLLKRDHYSASYQDYVTAKQNYSNLGTLKTKEIFSQELKDFLKSRDDLLREYLIFLLERGFSLFPPDKLSEVSSWIAWLDSDIENIDKLESMEELLDAAKELESRYPQIEKSIFNFLTNLKVYQQREAIEKIEKLIKVIKETLFEDFEDKEAIEAWFGEISSQLDKTKENHQSALVIMSQANVRRTGDALRYWRKASKIINDSHSSLLEVTSFLDEIIDNLEE